MPTLGKTDIGSISSSLSPDFQWASGPWVAPASGTISEIAWYIETSASLKLGVWVDNAGVPGALIASTATIAGGTGWRTGAASGQIVAGQSYWIGHIANDHATNCYSAASRTIRYVSTSYNTGLTDPYPGGSTAVNNREYSAYLTYSETPTLTLTSPKTRQLIQRNAGLTTATINLAGQASGFTGAIEARFAGGTWTTVATISANGSWSGQLTGQPLTAGTVEVRRVADIGTTASVANVMTGRLYLVTGDSIAEGRLTNSQSRNSVNSSVYRQDDAWAWADDPTDTGTVGGSHWPLLAQLLTSHFGSPVGFITTSTGSNDIAGFSNYYQKPNAGWSVITSQIAEAGAAIEAALLHLGPNAAVNDTLTQAAYLSALTTWANNLRNDVQAGVPIFLGPHGRSASTNAGNPKIRRAIAEAAATGVLSGGPNLIGQNWSDGVHPKTNADAALVAGRWFAALTGIRAPRITQVLLRSPATEVDVTFDVDLSGANGTTYTAALFDVDGTVATTATKVDTRVVRLVFATARSTGQTLTYAPAEHLGATMPSSVSVTLPVAIHGVTSVTQPADPVQRTITALYARNFVFDQLRANDGSAVTSGASVSILVNGVVVAGAGQLTHIAGGVWTYQPLSTEIIADTETVLILSHASHNARVIVRVTSDSTTTAFLTSELNRIRDEMDAIVDTYTDPTFQLVQTISGYLPTRLTQIDSALDAQETTLDSVEDNVSNLNTLIGGGRVTWETPLTPFGRLAGPIIIGDDYLAASGRAFDWFVDPGVFSVAQATCWFGFAGVNVGSVLVQGTVSAVTIEGVPKWRLRFEIPRSQTVNLKPGEIEASVELRGPLPEHITKKRLKGSVEKSYTSTTA
jgi:hypothetical protein